MCRLCLQRRKTFYEMSNKIIEEEEDEEDEVPRSPVEEEAILDSLPIFMQAQLTRCKYVLIILHLTDD